MKRTPLLLMALALFGARGAWAGNEFNVNVVLGDDGLVADCAVAALATADVDDGVNVAVKDGKGKARAPSEMLTVRITDGAKEIAKVEFNGANGGLPPGKYANLKLSLTDAKGAVIEPCTKLLAPAPKDTAEPAIKAEAAAPTGQLNASLLNEQALAWLASRKITGHAVTGGVHGKVYRLYHLPDGTPAFPMPAHASEEDRIELWLVLPSEAKATVEVIACDRAPAVRVQGSYKDVLEAAGQLHGRQETIFVLTSYPQPLQCAGTLTYKITLAGQGTDGSTTNALTLDPVYRFEWSVGYGFDFGKPRRLGLADRQPAGTDKVVVDPSEFTGAKPIVTLLVNVCGTNPSDLDWCDRYLNPTLWVDPTRLQKGFGVGLTVRPFFGVGILAGVSVFKSTELADGVSANPGDTWTAAGDLPTKEVFNRRSLGLMLAATVDADILTKMLK
jgi:hypothetical protein